MVHGYHLAVSFFSLILTPAVISKIVDSLSNFVMRRGHAIQRTNGGPSLPPALLYRAIKYSCSACLLLYTYLKSVLSFWNNYISIIIIILWFFHQAILVSPRTWHALRITRALWERRQSLQRVPCLPRGPSPSEHNKHNLITHNMLYIILHSRTMNKTITTVKLRRIHTWDFWM